MWEAVTHGGAPWKRRRWNNAFVAEYSETTLSYRIYEQPTQTLLLSGDAYSMTPERLEKLLEGNLRILAARDTRELPAAAG